MQAMTSFLTVDGRNACGAAWKLALTRTSPALENHMSPLSLPIDELLPQLAIVLARDAENAVPGRGTRAAENELAACSIGAR